MPCDQLLTAGKNRGRQKGTGWADVAAALDAERLSSHDDANSAQMTVNEMILDDHQQDGLQT
ncbi:MAG: hypothetical protein E5Y02_09375 [Mesorhizobium sp.]|nr:MAG: hypothetical protein E5Y02_09375 [Mesorhizobium sp.]